MHNEMDRASILDRVSRHRLIREECHCLAAAVDRDDAWNRDALSAIRKGGMENALDCGMTDLKLIECSMHKLVALNESEGRNRAALPHSVSESVAFKQLQCRRSCKTRCIGHDLICHNTIWRAIN